MNPTKATKTTQFKVGAFTILGLFLVGALSVYVNDRPFWWRPCQLVKINIEDATGLKTKSPIRSLGLEIGFLRSVDLTETHVSLGICITAPVEVLPSTRAYIRGEGFLGDKFVELKPVRYLGSPEADDGDQAPAKQSPNHSENIIDFNFISSAYAADPAPTNTATPNSAVATVPQNAPVNAPADGSDSGKNTHGGREIPVGENSQDIQQLVNRVDGLVNEMTGLTQNLRQGINPEELRQTMRQLNKTLENASKTLSPEGGLNQTAQRTLAKLEDAIEQLRDMMTRVNRGEGSVGMLLNDPSYAQQIREALDNLNRLLNKASHMRLILDVGAEEMIAYGGGRGYFELGIWPNADRYYRLGIAIDPRGSPTITNTATTAGGQTVTTSTTQTTVNSILVTGMLGKSFFLGRLDLSAGVQYGDGTVSSLFNLGPYGQIDKLQLRDDLYTLPNNAGVADRVTAQIHPISYFEDIYFRVGMEDFRRVNDKVDYFYGVGITFDDEDFKFLLSLK
jgi:phospholipid/cholesterol/gamma-HCH transport system substrate-binding protein